MYGFRQHAPDSAAGLNQAEVHGDATQQVNTKNPRGFSELSASALPDSIRRRIPRRAWSRRAEICYVLDPLPMGDGRFTTKVAARLEAMSTLSPLILTPAEHRALVCAIEEEQWHIEKARRAEQQRQANAAGHQILAVPSYVLPYDLQETICSSPSFLSSDAADEHSAAAADATGQQTAGQQTVLFDTCCIVDTDVADHEQKMHMVYVSRFADRLGGARSGSIYTAWMLKEHIDRGRVWDRDVERLEAHELHQVVNAHAVSAGATPPLVIEPDSRVVAFTELTLEEQYGLVPIKDPVFLRKEDVEEVDDEAAAILERAVAAITRQQADLQEQIRQRGEEMPPAQTALQRREFIAQQLETYREHGRLERLKCLLEEAEIWWSSQPRQSWKGNTFCLSPVFEEVEVPVLTPKGRVRRSRGQPVMRWERQHVGYHLMVGVPTVMPLPWHCLEDLLAHPSQGVKEGKGRASECQGAVA